MNTALTRERALEALKKYNREPFHILHALTVEGVMRWLARTRDMGRRRISGESPACCTTLTLRCTRSSTALRRRSF